MRTQLNKLESVFGSAIQIRNFGRSDRFVIEAEQSRVLEVAAWLRMEETLRMDFLEAFTVYESKQRLVLSYFVRSNTHSFQVVLRTSLPVPGPEEKAKTDSMIGVWSHAEPFESELAPLFGMDFTGAVGTGDVRKVFGVFGGYPLRKNFEWGTEATP